VKDYLPGGGGPAPTMSAQRKAQALKMAQCMRSHDVPSFPDPFTGGGGAPTQTPLPDANSPAFTHAASVCGGQGGFIVRAGNVQGP
jgi:hypothetical protein